MAQLIGPQLPAGLLPGPQLQALIPQDPPCDTDCHDWYDRRTRKARELVRWALRVWIPLPVNFPQTDCEGMWRELVFLKNMHKLRRGLRNWDQRMVLMAGKNCRLLHEIMQVYHHAQPRAFQTFAHNTIVMPRERQHWKHWAVTRLCTYTGPVVDIIKKIRREQEGLKYIYRCVETCIVDPPLKPAHIFHGEAMLSPDHAHLASKGCAKCRRPMEVCAVTEPLTDKTAMRMSCGHIFHHSCVDAIRNKTTDHWFGCPTCKSCFLCGKRANFDNASNAGPRCHDHMVPTECAVPLPLQALFTRVFGEPFEPSHYKRASVEQAEMLLKFREGTRQHRTELVAKEKRIAKLLKQGKVEKAREKERAFSQFLAYTLIKVMEESGIRDMLDPKRWRLRKSLYNGKPQLTLPPWMQDSPTPKP